MANLLEPQERVRAAINLGESHFREFKSAVEGSAAAKRGRPDKLIRKDIGEALVAFANADGGELLVGVEDDGTVTGVPHGLADIETFLDAPTTNVHPRTPLPPPLRIRVTVDGKLVLLFAVEKSTRQIHLTSDGRCLQRRDREILPVPAEQISFERQEQISREYDRQFVDGADPVALDAEVLARAGGIIAPGMSQEKLLQLLDLADFSGTVRLRRAALLLFARDILRWHPRCQVRIIRVTGTELKAGKEYNVAKDEPVSGPVFALMSQAWEALRPHLVQTRYAAGGIFEERILYPEDACREALTNAIAHRDYSIEGRGIEVFIYDDRMEVRSPGSLLSNVPLAELKKLKGLHQSRNALIARVLRELGYMREMGEGLKRIYQLMKAQDLVEPELISDLESFTIILHHRTVFSEAAQRWISAFDRFELSRREKKVVLLGADGSLFSPRQVWEALGIVDTEDYRSIVEGLQLKGILESTFPSRGASKRTRKSENLKRKDIARFKIRQPQDCEFHFAELIRACHSIPRDAAISLMIANRLNDKNPYKARLGRSMMMLGLLDADRRPTARLIAFIDALPEVAERTRRASSRATAPAALPTVTPSERRELEREAPRSIYVGNLAVDTVAGDVIRLFSQVGPVATVHVPRDLFTGRSRGFAFVRMERLEDAKAALERLDGSLLAGKIVRLSWSRTER